MKTLWQQNEKFRTSTKFILKTLFYIFVIVMLIYLYHYKKIDGGSFIYNEF